MKKLIILTLVMFLLIMGFALAGFWSEDPTACSIDPDDYLIFDLCDGTDFNSTWFDTRGQTSASKGICNITGSNSETTDTVNSTLMPTTNYTIDIGFKTISDEGPSILSFQNRHASAKTYGAPLIGAWGGRGNYSSLYWVAPAYNDWNMTRVDQKWHNISLYVFNTSLVTFYNGSYYGNRSKTYTGTDATEHHIERGHFGMHVYTNTHQTLYDYIVVYNGTDCPPAFVDTQPPTYTGFSGNISSSTEHGETINWTFIPSDETAAGDYWLEYFNGTIWVNDTPSSWTLDTPVTVTKVVSAHVNQIVNASFYFNDAEGNLNQTLYAGAAIQSTQLTIAIISPTDGQAVDGNLSVVFSFSSFNQQTANCTLRINRSIADVVNDTTFEGTQTNLSTELNDGDGNYAYNLTCTDVFSTNRSADKLVYILDTTIPTISIDPSTSFNLDNSSLFTTIIDLVFNFTFTDNLGLFQTLFNISDSTGVTVYENFTENHNVSVFNLNGTTDISSFSDGVYTVELSVSDDVSQSPVINDDLKKGKKGETFFVFNDTESRLEVMCYFLEKDYKFTDSPGDTIGYMEWNDEGTQLKFGMNFTVLKPETKVICELISPDKIYDRTGYYGEDRGLHFVWGKYFTNFEDAKFVNVNGELKETFIDYYKLSDNHYVLHIQGKDEQWEAGDVIDIDPITEGIHIVTEFYKFEIDTQAPVVSGLVFYALNSSGHVIGNETAFNETELQNIEKVNVSFLLSDTNNISGDISFFFTANGTRGCSLGNNQSDVCIYFPNFVEFQNGSETRYFKDAGNVGDSIVCAYNGNRTHRFYNCSLDEHYNPNVWKHYPFNFSNLKWQDGASQRININNMWKIELDEKIIPINASYYKLDFRVNTTVGGSLPTQPLNAYMCNSTYETVNGSPVASPFCQLVVSRFPGDLQDDGTKFRGIFTKNLTRALGDIKYVLLTTESIATEYYIMKTYFYNGQGTIRASTSNDGGNTFTRLADGYETELNINWFYNATDRDNKTQLLVKIFSADVIGNSGNSTTNALTWELGDLNTAPLVELLKPENNFVISGFTVVNWTTVDQDGDKFTTNITASNGTEILLKGGLFDTIFNFTFNTSVVSDGNYNLNVISCENDTSERLCGNDSHSITIDNTGPVINLTSVGNRSYFSDINRIRFNYTVVDVTNVTNCTLFIKDVTNETNTGENFSVSFPDGEHRYRIDCSDYFGNVGSSETRLFIVSLNPFNITTNITYNSDFFDFNGVNITILPTASEPFEVCLNNGSDNFGCINYTSGFYNKTFVWTGKIDWRRYFRFQINFSRYDNGAIVTGSSDASFSNYFNYDRQRPVRFTGDFQTNTNVSYLAQHEMQFVSEQFEFIELSHNITIFNNLQDLVATLFYDIHGTEKQFKGTSLPQVGNKTKFINNFFKNVSSNRNISFYWEYNFTLQNGTKLNFNTSLSNQTVKQLTFNTSCNDPILNVTLDDEKNVARLNSSLEVSFERMFVSSLEVDLNQSFNFSNISNAQFCVNTIDLIARYDIVLVYESSGYTQRIYNFLDELDADSTTTLPLYLSNDGNLTNIFITLFDENSNRLNDHYIKAERFYPAENTYRNVETVKSDFNGETLLHLIPLLVEYRFRILNFLGDEIKLVPRTTIKSSTVSITTQIGEPFLDEFKDAQDASRTLTFDNTTKEVTWQSSTEVYPQSCLSVVRLTSGGSTLYENCQSGDVVVDIFKITENTTDETYQFRGYFIGGDNVIVGAESIIHSELSTPERYGDLGILLSIMIVVTLFMIGIFNPAVGIALAFVGLVVSAYLGLIFLSLQMIILLAVMVGFLLYKMKT